jgi:hypothetical protein
MSQYRVVMFLANYDVRLCPRYTSAQSRLPILLLRMLRRLSLLTAIQRVLLKDSVSDSTSRAARSPRKLSVPFSCKEQLLMNDIGMPDVQTLSFAFSLIARNSDSTQHIPNAQADKSQTCPQILYKISFSPLYIKTNIK